MQLIRRVVCGDAHVILLARLQNACTELIKPGIILRCLDLVDELSGIEGNNIRLSRSVFAFLKDVHV